MNAGSLAYSWLLAPCVQGRPLSDLAPSAWFGSFVTDAVEHTEVAAFCHNIVLFRPAKLLQPSGEELLS